jgi:ABC-type bacteriocin/lantibiotic exporter with double-glycine peptidase domain
MGVLLVMNLKLALVTFAVIPLFFVVTNWFRRGARGSFREVAAGSPASTPSSRRTSPAW